MDTRVAVRMVSRMATLPPPLPSPLIAATPSTATLLSEKEVLKRDKRRMRPMEENTPNCFWRAKRKEIKEKKKKGARFRQRGSY